MAKRIRFTSFNAANSTSAIYEARSDGSNIHPLFPGWNNPPYECCGRWTSDGRYYVFQSIREGASNIWIVPDASDSWRRIVREPVQLTTGPLQFTEPLPSKDGKKLFVVGTQLRAELIRYDSEFGDFVPYLGGISAGDVAFLPRRPMGHLRQLPRKHSVALQTRRRRPPSAHVSPHANSLGPLVA